MTEKEREVRLKLQMYEDELRADPTIMGSRKSCGECQACCEEIGVPELRKPYRSKCEHQCDRGCAVYGNHPTSCKDYSCYWRLDVFRRLPEQARPDRLGVLVSLEEMPFEEDGRLWMWVDVYETRPGALTEINEGESKALFGMLMADLYAVIEEPGDVKVKGLRVYPHGMKIPADFDPGPKYDGPPSTKVRGFLAAQVGPPVGVLMKYQGPQDPR